MTPTVTTITRALPTMSFVVLLLIGVRRAYPTPAGFAEK